MENQGYEDEKVNVLLARNLWALGYVDSHILGSLHPLRVLYWFFNAFLSPSDNSSKIPEVREMFLWK
jgi:hypothetical protein